MGFTEKARSIVLCSLLTLTGALVPSESSACTCYVAPLAERYDWASTVFVATVGKPQYSTNASGDDVPEWLFVVDEVFKGNVTFNTLKRGPCATRINAGEQYLIFSDGSGDLGPCSTGHLNSNERFRADLAILRDFRDRKIIEVVEPLVFSKLSGSCYLTLAMSHGHGRLMLEYRFADAAVVDLPNQQFRYDATTRQCEALENTDVHPAYFAGFKRAKVKFPLQGRKIANSGRLKIGEQEWRTDVAPMEHPDCRWEITAEYTFDSILDGISNGGSVGVSAEYVESGLSRSAYPDLPVIEGRTPLYYSGDSIDNFRSCMDGGSSQH